MKNKYILFLYFLLLNALTFAQTKTCDCGKEFNFLATSYIKDYSGFQDFAKQNPDYLKVIEKLSKQASAHRFSV